MIEEWHQFQFDLLHDVMDVRVEYSQCNMGFAPAGVESPLQTKSLYFHNFTRRTEFERWLWR